MGLRLLDLVLFIFSLYLVHDALKSLPLEAWLRTSETALRPLRWLLTWSLGFLFFRVVLLPSLTMVMGPVGELIRSVLR